MIDARAIELLTTLLDQFRDMTNATHAFVWAVYRSLILLGVVVALCGMMTLFNLWMLHKAGILMREIASLLDKLIERESR